MGRLVDAEGKDQKAEAQGSDDQSFVSLDGEQNGDFGAGAGAVIGGAAKTAAGGAL